MTKISSSQSRGTFQIDRANERVKEGTTTQDQADLLIEIYMSWNDEKRAKEQDPDWQQDNLEWDLRTTDWILHKVRDSDRYAQNLYAALCNNEFQRLEVWPILTNKTYGCSWRYAGGIIADMLARGDYIDWYCSGIQALDAKDMGYVSEGVVTDEIAADLERLGWRVLNTNDS